MLDDFKELFRDKNIPEGTIAKYADDFSKIVLGTIYTDMVERLTPEEDQQFAALLKERKFDELTVFVKAKYTDEDFAKLLETKISPIADEYVQMMTAA